MWRMTPPMVNSLCPHPPPLYSALRSSKPFATEPKDRNVSLSPSASSSRPVTHKQGSELKLLGLSLNWTCSSKNRQPPPSFKITDIYSLLLTSFHGFIRRDEFIMSPFLCNHASVCINGTGFGKTNTGVGLFTQTETHFV